MHAPSVVGTIQVLVGRAPLDVSGVVRMGISYESVQRTGKVMVMGAIEPNLHQLLHQTGLHLEDLLLILAEDQIASMRSRVAKSKRTLQMLSLV